MNEMTQRNLTDLERWILDMCYRKTVTRGLPEDWLEPRGRRDFEWSLVEFPELRKTRLTLAEFNDFLFPSEILLNYFHLERAARYDHGSLVNESFVDSREYRRALDILGDALTGLAGLVKVHPNTGITLFESGKAAEPGVESGT
jgi:hypothetical protein